MIENFDNGIVEQSHNERVGENNTPANDGVSAAITILNPKEQSTTMKEGTIEYRNAFRWGKGWGDRVVNYRLSDEGVLTVVRKNSLMVANPAPDAVETEYYDEVGNYSYSPGTAMSLHLWIWSFTPQYLKTDSTVSKMDSSAAAKV